MRGKTRRKRGRKEGWTLETFPSCLRLNLLVQRLEERDKNSELTMAASEKEMALKQQALELHKKRVWHQ